MNLLPKENKILFKKYYLRRLFVVFSFLIFSAIVAGIIVLIPMHLFILSHKKNSGVKITSFSYEKGNTSKIKDKVSIDDDKISLYGKARKRDDLLLFENQLKKEWGDQKIVSPVSNLINEKDLDFSLTLYIQIEK